MDHFMCDLETMSTADNAAIVSIGLVKFTEDKILDTLGVNIRLKSSQEYGLHIDADTVVWWLGQSNAAKVSLLESGMELAAALWRVSDIMTKSVNPRLWGNGANFDNTILKRSYKATNLPVPWKFTHDRCFRTMKSMFSVEAPEREGVHHNALDDAIYQVRHLQKICQQHGVTLS